MIPLFVTLPRGQAEAVLAGRATLSSIELPRELSVSSEDTIEIYSELTPPMSEREQSLEIILDVPDALLQQHLRSMIDHPNNTYVIPRVWLDAAKCRLMADSEILELCRRYLNYAVLPSPTPRRVYMERAIKAGDTAHISPFYIRAIRDSPA